MAGQLQGSVWHSQRSETHWCWCVQGGVLALGRLLAESGPVEPIMEFLQHVSGAQVSSHQVGVSHL